MTALALERPIRRPATATLIGWGVVVLAAVLFWSSNQYFDARRGDFFYLADAFLHGRTWLEFRPGTADVIPIGEHIYVPFAPFPAIAFMPLVALIGPVTADQWESGINAALAASGVGMCWWLLARIGVARIVDRIWLVLLFGFSTQILWVTTRGGVWHTGHLIATILTFGCLIEIWGKQRGLVIGLLAGAAFLTRAPLAFALPFYALMLSGTELRPAVAWDKWRYLVAGFIPAFTFFFVYNVLRFGDPLQSGYGLATLPEWLQRVRDRGLFSVVHIPMNIDYFLLKLPGRIPDPPFFKPDGLGMSVLFTSPGLLYAARASWSWPRSWFLLGAAVLVLIPTLLYYGGGWLQYGYRYFLDSVPFVMALCGIAAAVRGPMGAGWKLLIAWGVVIGACGIYWAYFL